VGPLARSVRDAAYVLTAIAGPDPRDPFTIGTSEEEDYSECLSSKETLDGACFGLPQRRIWDAIDQDVLPTMLSVVDKIKAAGAKIYTVDFPCWEEMISDHGWDWSWRSPEKSESTVCCVDFYNDLKSYLSELSNTSVRSVEDVIAFNDAHSKEEGARPGDNPACPKGHDTLLEVIDVSKFQHFTFN
jgi:amidase